MIAVSSLQKSVFKLIRSESIISSLCIFLFENTNYIAAKNFLYKDDLPYCYVNDLFIELLGYKKINLENYFTEKKPSSLRAGVGIILIALFIVW